MKRLDLTGQQFGRLTVIEVAAAQRGRVLWRCKCECGTEREVSTTHLRSGHTRSCGCVRTEETVARNRAQAKHGMHASAEFGVWSSMLKRCHSPGAHGYERYGGRGIAVCEEWRASFQSFYDHIGPRPSPAHSVERIDNGLGYQPGNVKWATAREQNNNRRNNVTAQVDGVTLTAAQISERFGIKYSTVLFRIHKGMHGQELTAPPADRAERARSQRRGVDA